MYSQLIQQLVVEEDLPASYAADAQRYFVPLINELEDAMHQCQPAPYLLGINGAQGTGKSTLGKLIDKCLSEKGYNVVVLSLDDFYLAKAERATLARQVHPLLATRGVPGTHDVSRLRRVISALGKGEASQLVLPRFDKASDDVVPAHQCPVLEACPHLLVLEGWFVGASPQDEDSLQTPVNRLEAEQDPDGEWRRYVNERLASDYFPIFELLDQLVLLKAPSFEMVYEWRGLQEEKLRAAQIDGHNAGASAVMSSTELEHFIQHYERLTRHCLATLPHLAGTVFILDEKHRITGRNDR